MKIAIPTRNNVVDDHFGHCEYYTIFTIDENKNIIAKERHESPEGSDANQISPLSLPVKAYL